MSEFDKLLHELYYNPSTGYIGIKKLYEKARDLNDKIRMKDVASWYKAQVDIQRFTDNRNKLPFFKITSHNPNSWQADLMFVGRQKVVIFTAVNINSRIGFARALKSKKMEDVTKALKELIKKHKVTTLTTDNGSEFDNSAIKLITRDKKHPVLHYMNQAGDHNTMGKIERFNRTIKAKIKKMKLSVLTNKIIDEIIDNYNSTEHRSINATPDEMKGKVIEKEIEHNQDLAQQVPIQFSEGDTVVHRLKRKTFQKEGEQWSKTVYKVTGMKGNRVEITSGNGHIRYVPHYDLKHVKAPVTDSPVEKNQIVEVEKILDHKTLKNGTNKYLIKWVNIKEPTWEPEKNLRLTKRNQMSELEEEYFASILNR